MSIKNFVKTHAPLPLRSILRVPYHAAVWPFREARLCRIYHRAMKYLPYYQDELSREILRCRIAYIRDGDKNHFFDLGEKYGWVFRSLYGAGATEYSGITVIYSSKDKNFQYVRKLLVKLFGSDNASYITLNDFVSGAEIPKNELVLCALGWNEASIAASYAKKETLASSESLILHVGSSLPRCFSACRK